MMQMGKKYLLIAPAILITVLVLSLKTSVWNSYFQSELNKYINSSGWSIQVERAEGYLFSTSVFNNINLIHNNGSSLKITRIFYKYWIIFILTRNSSF